MWGRAIATAKDFSRSFVLNEEEQKLLVGVIDQWADAQVPKRDDPYLSELSQGPSRNAIGGLCFILDDIVIPRKIGLKLLIKIQKLNDVGISGYSLITGLVRSLAEHLDELASVLRSGIVSDKTDVAEGAIVGLHEWLISSSDNKFNLQQPPDDLVREIGLIISVRRKTGLSQAMSVAKWIFEEGSEQQMTDICELVVQGLSYMIDELSYRKHRDHFDDVDVPLLRWRCAQLANAISIHRSNITEPVISRWIEIAKHDPLPEVRYL